MSHRRASALAAFVFGAAVGLPGPAAAQSFASQPQYYQLTTDVMDGRALWLQPAALVSRRESSVSVMLTGDKPAGGGFELGQFGLTLASGPLGLGWQHDRFGTSGHGDAFIVGYALGRPSFSVGVDHRWHRGTLSHSGAWDIGGRVAPNQNLLLSLVWRDIGSPVIFADSFLPTLTPAAALLLGNRMRVGADWEVVTSGWKTSAVRVGASLAINPRLALALRTEFSGGLNITGFSLALSWSGAASRFTAFRSDLRSPAPDHYGIWASAIGALTTRTRGAPGPLGR